MRRPPQCAVATGLAMLLALGLLASSASAHQAARPSTGDVARVPVTMTVDNVNRSLLPCAADGREYRLQGTLVGPRRLLRRATVPMVTVYVHDITQTAWFWSPEEFPRFDFVQRLAERGHVALIFDRLGYGDSPHPAGMATCLGAQADMLAQVTRAARAGVYDATRRLPRAKDVVLAGHSVGGGIAEVAVSSFGGVDGLVLMSWSDVGVSDRAVTEGAAQHEACLRRLSSNRRAYAHYGQSDRAYREMLFWSAPEDLVAAATARRVPDPCGDALTLSQLVSTNAVANRLIDVPVLLLFGKHDALNAGPARADDTSHTRRSRTWRAATVWRSSRMERSPTTARDIRPPPAASWA